jgi:4'-phosphopantetheinyl transferase EntD
MPIFFQQDIDETTRLAVWKIEEDESFFLQHVPLQREITHPHKRLQHLAGRYLLKKLFPDFPLELIRIADTRKPFLEDEAYHFSISHCGDFAGVIVSTTNRVGMDVELVSEKVNRIRHKFITAEEENLLEGKFPDPTSSSPIYHSNQQENGPPVNDHKFTIHDSRFTVHHLPTLVWSCKEAVFKWYGLGGLEFREHMIVKSLMPVDDRHYETIILFSKQEALFLNLRSMLFGQLCMSYVVT